MYMMYCLLTILLILKTFFACLWNFIFVPSFAEPETLLEAIVHKGTTDVQHGLEEGSGLLAESNPSVAESVIHPYRSFLKRKKRAILFPSGVKVCPEETFDQALVNHMKFFKLRGKPRDVNTLEMQSPLFKCHFR